MTSISAAADKMSKTKNQDQDQKKISDDLALVLNEINLATKLGERSFILVTRNELHPTVVRDLKIRFVVEKVSSFVRHNGAIIGSEIKYTVTLK